MPYYNELTEKSDKILRRQKQWKILEDRILLFPNYSSFYRFEEIKRNIDKVNK